MRKHFVNTGKMVKVANREAAKLDFIRPPEGIEPWRLGNIGHAIDYRIRFNYPEMNAKNTIAFVGASVLGRHSRIFFDLLDEAEEFRANVRPDLGTLEPDDEDKLCRYCYNMALFETGFRIRELNKDLEFEFHNVADLVSKPPKIIIDDIIAQNARYRMVMPDYLNEMAMLNPTFRGSRDVGGADADLLVGGCLIELKSSRKNLGSDDLRQVLGYCLLDYEDEHRITSLAIYRTRYGINHRWTIDDMLVRAMNFPKPLPDLRNELRELLQSTSRGSNFKA